jgi:asparagine synthase (glutamine-hydrolysing)
MSGICGIVNTDGAPVDRPLLDKMTAFLAFRGPDAQEVWIDGAVGFGHSLLRTTFESEHERQPLSLDGKVWITADARIDGQAELRTKMTALGGIAPPGCADAELILHAYSAWGEDCVKHLIGDFAFAIWDGTRRQLFCARDHFGVKPFFYASVGPCLAISNTLNCLRTHPAISDRLNDLAIADFLLYEENQDPSTTAFEDIQRLPPAHTLLWSEGRLRVQRYWTLPTELGVRYRPKGDYVEHFKELLAIAVRDRLRTDNVGVEMSGGLDSTAVAAAAVAALKKGNKPFKLQAYSYVYETPDPKDERYYSEKAAEKLDIPITHFFENRYGLYERFGSTETQRPEPLHDPSMALMVDGFQQMAGKFRVCLTGWEGDGLLHDSPKPYFRSLLRQGRLLKLSIGMLRYAVSERRVLPGWLRDWFNRGKAELSPPVWPYPGWLDPELEQRLGLKTRWQKAQEQDKAGQGFRPYALRTYSHISAVSNFFEPYDAGSTGCAIEYRHPLMDLRLIDYCLSLPPYPWCVRKRILREALRGVLPEEVRLRPKTPLVSWHCLAPLRRPNPSGWEDRFVASSAKSSYVDWRKVPAVDLEADPGETWMNLRPISLDFWLKGLRQQVVNVPQELQMTDNTNSPKKPYTPPVMHVYGDIRTITQAATMGGATADGGPPGMTKT